MKINGTACAAADRKSHASMCPACPGRYPKRCRYHKSADVAGCKPAQAQQCRPAARLISASHHAHSWYACHKFLKLLTNLFDQRMASKRAQPRTFEHKGILYKGIRVGLFPRQPQLSYFICYLLDRSKLRQLCLLVQSETICCC